MEHKSLIDLFYPPRCAVCDTVLPFGTSGACQRCLRILPYVEEPRCFRCGQTVEDEEEEYCSDCRRRRHLYQQAFPVLQYIPPVSDAVVAMKYRGRAEYADFYGRLMGEFFRETWKTLAPEALVPVPVHPHRLRKRGYNQAELLAKAMSKVTGIPVRADLLMRVEDTKAQKALSREDRSLNLRAAFQAGEGPMPRRLVLVDDIYTTGATADACTEALLRAGAERVYVATVCCGAG